MTVSRNDQLPADNMERTRQEPRLVRVEEVNPTVTEQSLATGAPRQSIMLLPVLVLQARSEPRPQRTPALPQERRPLREELGVLTREPSERLLRLRCCPCLQPVALRC